MHDHHWGTETQMVLYQVDISWIHLKAKQPDVVLKANYRELLGCKAILPKPTFHQEMLWDRDAGAICFI